jgi:hypothetical protein
MKSNYKKVMYTVCIVVGLFMSLIWFLVPFASFEVGITVTLLGLILITFSVLKLAKIGKSKSKKDEDW